MKVLFLADVHSDARAIEWVRKKGTAYSAIIVGGDVGRGGAQDFAFEFLAAALSTERGVFFVPGNADSPDTKVPAGVVELHGRKPRLGGYTIGGLGGSNPTPFHTPFEIPDAEARAVLSRVGHVEILVSHCPPFDTQCDRAGAIHVGSVPVREFVSESSPLLVLSGHAHESKAKDALGRTILVNPGPLMQGNYAEVELDGAIGVELKSDAR